MASYISISSLPHLVSSPPYSVIYQSFMSRYQVPINIMQLFDIFPVLFSLQMLNRILMALMQYTMRRSRRAQCYTEHQRPSISSYQHY